MDRFDVGRSDRYSNSPDLELIEWVVKDHIQESATGPIPLAGNVAHDVRAVPVFVQNPCNQLALIVELPDCSASTRRPCATRARGHPRADDFRIKAKPQRIPPTWCK